MFEAIQSSGLQKDNHSVSLHLGDPKSLIESDTPVAFSSLIRLNEAGQKNVPFIVLSSKTKDLNEVRLSIVLANEFYDILGRLEIGDGRAYSDGSISSFRNSFKRCLLKRQLHVQNGLLSKGGIISISRYAEE